LTKRIFKILAASVAVLLGLSLLGALGVAAWHLYQKLPVREGAMELHGLKASVRVAYDERGVPHIRAKNEMDMYRALGYVHAQDRLFQMEMVRRLARGELAEIFGPKLLDTDRLFRTLGIRAHADRYAAQLDPTSPATQALLAYLDGINEYQASRPAPLEFELLGIPSRAFTPADTISVAGYLAYSFAAALRTEPVLTFVRDQLGANYLKVFDLDWHPQGVIGPGSELAAPDALSAADWRSLNRLASASQQALDLAGVPHFAGSNAWAVSGRLTASGKPLLAGDPHIAFSAPSVWYEAHLSAPGFELYGHHQALNPLALLGHNFQFGWSLTMFQNDDMDLIAEKVNPANPNQVWYQGQWVDLSMRKEKIAVKDGDPVTLSLRQSPHGPIINEAFADSLGKTPIAMWWGFLQTENPILDAFYELNRADTRAKARSAASKIHSPGLNVVWASANGDIAWWAAAKLTQRPPNVNPAFILNGATAEADKPGFYRFQDNPKEENPARGYIVSANHQPLPASGVPVPGYYNLPDRAFRLNQLLANEAIQWDTQNSQSLQKDSTTGFGPRLLKPLMAELMKGTTDSMERSLLEQLARWNGHHDALGILPTVFNQFVYELAKGAMADELGEAQFKNLLRTRALDAALPRLAADADSPWWDNRKTKAVETRADTLQNVWRATIDHLKETLGETPMSWGWNKAHTLTHKHPLGQKKPLHLLYNVGPFEAPGGRELPNNLSTPIGPAPWAVSDGPSTRRIIDFANVNMALGINPVGQSGVLFDRHYSDQANAYIAGQYLPQWMGAEDIKANTRSVLTLKPAP
jgi:penicillin G amidase